MGEAPPRSAGDSLRIYAHRLAQALGRHAAVVADLTAFVAEFPYRERLRAQLMMALHRQGRSSEALDVYREGRRLLVDELGLEPGRELAEAERAVLAGEPDEPDGARPERDLAAARPAGPRRPSWSRPAELPLAASAFIGRRAELAALDALPEVGEGDPLPLCVVSGPAGVGKTALALHWAHSAVASFPDGQLYADVRGYDAEAAPTAPALLLERFLRTMGVPAERIPAEHEAREALFRSTPQGRRVLIVLDNAASSAQVRPLLRGAPGRLVLVTARRRLEGLVAGEGARSLTLDLLTAGEAVELLRAVAGPERVARDTEAAVRLGALCDRLPLALRIAGARLVARPRRRLATLAGRLAEQGHRLAELAVDDRAVRTGFGVSYDDLAGGPAARMFRLLGLLDVPDIAPAVAAALANVSELQAEDLLETLVDMHLVETPSPRRYRMHDLLRLFARERAAVEETAEERGRAVRRALDHYLATVRAAAREVNPADQWREDVVRWRLSTPGTALASAAEAHAWVERERECLLAAGRQAATAPGDGPEIAIGLAVAFHMPLEYRGRWREQLALGTVALEAAESTGDPRHFAIAHNDLGWAHWAMAPRPSPRTPRPWSRRAVTAAGTPRRWPWATWRRRCGSPATRGRRRCASRRPWTWPPRTANPARTGRPSTAGAWAAPASIWAIRRAPTPCGAAPPASCTSWASSPPTSAAASRTTPTRARPRSSPSSSRATWALLT
ncbi:MAG: AAA family ATPase [Streptosporangiales bacterium]|nr:AAA family ATPase [Streptosporangiales bacterium]